MYYNKTQIIYYLRNLVRDSFFVKLSYVVYDNLTKNICCVKIDK